MKKILILLLVFLTSLYSFNNDTVLDEPLKSDTINLDINKIEVFGSKLFTGKWSKNKITLYNEDYKINIGDKISIKIWGAINTEFITKVDNKWNIFIPEIGVINLNNVKNSDLQKIIEAKLRTVYKSNVFVYSNLISIVPINVFVSGNVVSPGMYEGFSTDSIINFIDKSGGINNKYGSYRNIDIIRNGKIFKKIDLYNFLLNGRLENFMFKNGDTIFINNIGKNVIVYGEVFNQNKFEINKENLKELLYKISMVKDNATDVVVTNYNDKYKTNRKLFKLSNIENINIKNGDIYRVVSNHYTKDLRIEIKGVHDGVKEMFVHRGTTLEDIINKINLNKMSNIKNIQIFRKSVAVMQKKLIDAHLKELEVLITTQPAHTVNEGLILEKEQTSILKFIEKAKEIKPKGQIVISKNTDFSSIILEDGDIIQIPSKNNIVIIDGEVSFPGAHTYVENLTVEDYIEKSGGFTNKANHNRILLIHQNGEVVQLSDSLFGSKTLSYKVDKTDSILVLPEVTMKKLQITKDITEVLYQIALSAGVILAL